MNQDHKNEDSQYTVSVLDAKDLVEFQFVENEKAQSMLHFIQSFIPILEGEYPKLETNVVVMTEEQYHFYKLYLSQSREHLLYELIPDHYFLKTLRADEFDFSHAFIKGIIPGEKSQRRQNLRPSERKPIIITPQREVVVRFYRTPKYDPVVKSEYSQIQSCTFIDKETQSSAFGFSQSREDRLYGLMTHEKDLLVHRALIRDSGTVSRVFEFDAENDAKASVFRLDTKEARVLFSPEEFHEFKEVNLKVRSKERRTNEFLARLRFNPYRSVVCICSNKLESRLLAKQFSMELLTEFKEYAARNDMRINPNYRIPIVFYVPQHSLNPKPIGVLRYKHSFQYYTEALQKQDQAEAFLLSTKDEERKRKYVGLECEFLLGLDEITSDDLLEKVSKDFSLAEKLLRLNRGRLLLRLFESRNTNKSEVVKNVFNALLEEDHIKKNDLVISELIKIEAFEIADFLIKKTNTNKTDLLYNSIPIKQWIIQFGSPRHMNFMGLQEMLLMAEDLNRWTIIKLCIKEYPEIEKTILGTLLLRAFLSRRYNEVKFLLENGAIEIPEAKKVFQQAVYADEWNIVAIFLNFRVYIDSDFYKSLYEYIPVDIIRRLFLNLSRYLDKTKYDDLIHFAILHEIGCESLMSLGAFFDGVNVDDNKCHVQRRSVLLAYDAAHYYNKKDTVGWLEYHYPFLLKKKGSLNELEIGELLLETCFHNRSDFEEYRLNKYFNKDRVRGFVKLLLYLSEILKNVDEEHIAKFCEKYFFELWGAFLKLASIKKIKKENTVAISFKNQGIAKTFVGILSRFMPHENDKYPKIDGEVVIINYDQYYFCKTLALKKTENYPKENINYKFVLKKFQRDDLCKLNDFISSITLSCNSEKKRGYSKKYDATIIDDNRILLAASSGLTDFDDVPDSEKFYIGVLTHIGDSLVCQSHQGLKKDVKARFRFNPYRTLIVIGESSLDSELVAVNFSEALMRAYSAEAQKGLIKINPNFKLPVIYYIPRLFICRGVRKIEKFVDRYIKYFSERKLQYSRKIAESICWNEYKRHEKYENGHFGFLLGLADVDVEMLFEEYSHSPLAVYLIVHGFSWIIAQLLKKSSLKLTVNFIERLLSQSSEDVELVICHLIMSEEFWLAEKLIARTLKNYLWTKKHDECFIDFLIKNGNPRQLNFVGFNQVLLRAAEKGNWKLIRRCLKEYPNIDKTLLSELLNYASYKGNIKELSLLLGLGADASFVRGNPAIVHAAQRNDWETVSIFSEFHTDEMDKAEYGYALLKALSAKEANVALKLLEAGAKPFSREFLNGLESTLYYAVQHGFNELLPSLIHFESQGEHTAAFYSRCLLARDLAITSNNLVAAEVLDKAFGHHSVIDPQNILIGIARVFMQALFFENKKLAEYRLIHYSNQFGLLGEDRNNIILALSNIFEYLDTVYIEFPDAGLSSSLDKIMSQLYGFIVDHYGQEFLLSTYRSGHSQNLFYTFVFYRLLLRALTDDSFSVIEAISKEITHNEKRQKEWQAILDEEFTAAVYSCNHSTSYCLVRLGAQPKARDDGTTDFDTAAFDGNIKVVEYLLAHFNFNQNVMNEALRRSVITGWNSRIPTLLLENDAELNPEMVLIAADKDEDIILSLVEYLDEDKFNSADYEYAVYALWCSSYSKPRLLKKLLKILDHDWITHYMLLHIYSILFFSLSESDFLIIRDIFIARYPVISAHFFGVFQDAKLRDINKLKFEKMPSIEVIDAILLSLYRYFSVQNNVLAEMPNVAVLRESYQSLKSLIEEMVYSKKNKASFFKPAETPDEFLMSMKAYFDRVDGMLIHKPLQQGDDVVHDGSTAGAIVVYG